MPNEDLLSENYDLNGQTEVAEICDKRLPPGGKVFKIGRITDLTRGAVHTIPVELRTMKLPPNRKYKKPVRILSEQLVIMFSVPAVYFNEPGDTGSWILDEKGHLAGLLWATLAPGY